MDLRDRSDLQALLARHGIALAKTYGQHFLVDRAALERIVSAAFPAGRFPGTVIEVGPGAGTLTVELASRAARVVAIERDERFIPVLKETLAGFEAVRVELGDAMALRLSDLPEVAAAGERYAVVSNLPYEISTPFLWKVLYDEPRRPSEVSLLLQEEVIDRALAKAPKMNLLSLLVALAGKAEKACKVGRSSFYPPPRVESAALRIEGIGERIGDREKAALALAKRAFAAPRKKLANTIGAQAGAHGDRRPGELGAEEWLALASLGGRSGA